MRGCKTLFYLSLSPVIIVQASFPFVMDFGFYLYCTVLPTQLPKLPSSRQLVRLLLQVKAGQCAVYSFRACPAGEQLLTAVDCIVPHCALQVLTAALFYGIYLHFSKCGDTKVPLCSAMKHGFVDSKLLPYRAACFFHLFLGVYFGHRITTFWRYYSRAKRLATILRCGLHMLHGVLATNCLCDAARCTLPAYQTRRKLICPT
ncbi:hypothetical protein TRVL_05889 [Trypanosoma vivax]|nr:hypothetical protein TRVL_05889 [Trypanosoma vivax]